MKKFLTVISLASLIMFSCQDNAKDEKTTDKTGGTTNQTSQDTEKAKELAKEIESSINKPGKFASDCIIEAGKGVDKDTPCKDYFQEQIDSLKVPTKEEYFSFMGEGILLVRDYLKSNTGITAEQISNDMYNGNGNTATLKTAQELVDVSKDIYDLSQESGKFATDCKNYDGNGNEVECAKSFERYKTQNAEYWEKYYTDHIKITLEDLAKIQKFLGHDNITKAQAYEYFNIT